ncbi:MAG TPA: hypothetical protein VM686_14125 [Polyangiaceae bacterium]|nr:hypothetical protein [Polyangiaceae bacterium]
MRVLHAEPGGDEAAELLELDRRIERFWQAGAVLAELGPFAADLSLERGCGEDGRPLSLLRSTEPSARPLIERVLARVPAELAPRFAALQPRLGLEQALAQVRARSGVDLTRATARAGFSRGHLLDVSLFVPGGRGPSDEPAARELVRALVGESVWRDWIGEVRTAPVPRGLLRVLDNAAADERSFPLAELCPAVDAAVRGVHDGLAAEPWWADEREREYIVFELAVEPAEDYAAQDDVALVSTCAPEMLHCFLRAAPFSSLRFSRHGELFAYLKYRAPGRDLAQAVEQRDRLEHTLDAALAQARAGRVVGRGMGLAYVYLDLALSDLHAALSVLRAQDGALPRDSWLLFCDSHLGEEWIAVHDGAPVPPGMS